MKIIKEPDDVVLTESLSGRLKWSWWNDETLLGNGQKVVFNTKHRSVIIVSQDFKPETGDFLATEARKNLCRLGMLVNADTDEVAEFERQYIAAKKDLRFLDLTVLTTRQCQLNCVYCFEGGKSRDVLTSKVCSDVMNFLHGQTHACRKLRVTWFGGKPLLGYKQMLELSLQLINFCKEHSIEYSADITTNGFALSPERCKELVEKLRVHRYIITIDGPKAVHDSRRPLFGGSGSFDRIWRNIGLLLQAGAQVTVRMTIDRNNVEFIPALLDDIAKSDMAGRIGLSFCRTIDFGFTPDVVKSGIYTEDEFADVEWNLLQYARKLGLLRYSIPHAAPRGGCLRDGDIVIGVNGEIYKCLDTLGDERWVTGNIADRYSGEKPDWYSSWLKWTPTQSPSCQNCRLMPLCSGGCPHNALFRNKMHGTSSQCPDWKMNYQRQIKAIADEYEQAL